MMSITQYDVDRVNQAMDNMLFSELSQSLRVEWSTETDGTAIAYNNSFEDSTLTTNILNTRCTLSRLRKFQLKELDASLVKADPAIITLPDDVNLEQTLNPRFITSFEGFYRGDGTSASDVWTPDTNPGWVVDRWKGYWLWFSAKRFEILSNTASTITVDLDGDTLPTAVEAKIAVLEIWYPVFNNPDANRTLRAVIGNRRLGQSLLCTLHPVIYEEA